MKELIKPNPSEQDFIEIKTFCTEQCAKCPSVTCFCDGGYNESIPDEDGILF